VSSDDLEAVPDSEVELPDGVAILDGDVSPDGSMLAMLATISGSPVEYDTGATHVISIPFIDGRLRAESMRTVQLGPGDGAAKWIRWQTTDRWAVERETSSSKVLEILATDGSPVSGPADIGWGWGLVPVPSGVLRARNGGVEVIGIDQLAVPGNPPPVDHYLDRRLALAGLVDVPDFTPRPSNPIAPLTITPVVADSDAPAPTEGSSPPSTAGSPGSSVPTSPTEQAGDRVSSDDGSSIAWRAVATFAVVAAVGAAFVMTSRWSRRRPSVGSPGRG
jgi:hypothetical protein